MVFKALEIEKYLKFEIKDILSKFGHYENYLNTINKNKTSKEFSLKYYPNLIEDEMFNIMINTINPIATITRTNVKFSLDLYEKITILLKNKNYFICWNLG